MDKINDLIVYLMAIQNNAKDIHYNCYGEDFYGKHLFADRIGEGLDDFIDQLKEICLLGHNEKVLHSNEYLERASKLVPLTNDFGELKELMMNCLILAESVTNVSRGDSKLIDDICSTIQNNIGLINIMYGDK